MATRIAGTGCALMDRLFVGVDFGGAAFGRYRSRIQGDGGLSPGKLVFVSDVEAFAGESFADMLGRLAPDRDACTENIGGPSIVAMIHAAQMLEGDRRFTVSFHGLRGDDGTGERLAALLSGLPPDCAAYRPAPGATPSTYVLSDPGWDGGQGERCFVNELGVAAEYTMERLIAPVPGGTAFLDADIVAFGGTALVPALHDSLGTLLPVARDRGCLTVVNTVFDFRNERRDPSSPWPLGAPGDSERSYRACDLLVMDRDEAMRLSGRSGMADAADFFMQSGAGAFVITQGPGDVVAWARGAGRFAPLGLRSMPVPARAEAGLRDGTGTRGDTTGCGDAFAGGVVAALAVQMETGKDGSLDLADAVSWGIAAGTATLGILGGTWYEKWPGEKRAVVESCRMDHLARLLDTGPGGVPA